MQISDYPDCLLRKQSKEYPQNLVETAQYCILNHPAHDSTLRLHSQCLNLPVECLECQRKIFYIKTFSNKSYSESLCSKNILFERFYHSAKQSKVYPERPSVQRYRPVIISSWILRFFESLVLEKLQSFCKSQIEPERVRFVCKMSTQVHLFQPDWRRDLSE